MICHRELSHDISSDWCGDKVTCFDIKKNKTELHAQEPRE